MNFYETKYKEIKNINDLIYSKMNNGNILFHYNFKTKQDSGERPWKKIVEIKVYNQKLELIYENQLKSFKNFNCFAPCNEFFELKNGNMIYNTNYIIYIIKNILKDKKIYILQTIEVEGFFKVRELKNNDLLLFNSTIITIYKKEEKYIKNYDINIGKGIIECTSLNKKMIAILKIFQRIGKVIFYNLKTKQINFVFEDNKEDILSFIKLKNNPDFFVVSCKTNILVFDIKKFKINQIVKKKKIINIDTEYNEYMHFYSMENKYHQILELNDGSLLIWEYCSNEKISIIIDRFKIENNLLKYYYFSSGKLDFYKYIIPFNNEIVGCYNGISLKFFKIGIEKATIKFNKNYKNLKDLLK